MDERIFALLNDVPVIFEKKLRTASDLRDDWVIVDMPDDTMYADDVVGLDDDMVDDLDRFDRSAGAEGEERSPPLPSGMDIDKAILANILRRPQPAEIQKLRRRIRGNFPGGPGPKGGKVPPPDAFGLYLPFHLYPDMWGIYLLDSGVASFARMLSDLVNRYAPGMSIRDARLLAMTFLFHHQAYHAAVEAFALRCELPLNKPVYRSGVSRLFKRQWLPGLAHEDTLATAYAIRKIRDNIRFPTSALDAVCTYVEACLPPYNSAIVCLDDDRFEDQERMFMEEVIRSSHSRGNLPSSAWIMGADLMTAFLQRSRRYAWIGNRKAFDTTSTLASDYFTQRAVLACLQRIADAAVEPGGRHLYVERRVANAHGSTAIRRSRLPTGEIRKSTLARILMDLDIDMSVDAFRDECASVGRPLG